MKKEEDAQKKITELQNLNYSLYANKEKELTALEEQNKELRAKIEYFQQQQITENQFYQDEMFHLNEEI